MNPGGNLNEPLHHLFTLLSLWTLFGWVIGALPAVSLFVTAAWGALKCFETWQRIKLNKRELDR